MHEKEARAWGDMRVVLKKELAIHPNEASVHRVLCAERCNAVRLHVEETLMHECEAGVLRDSSPVQGVIARVRGGHAWLQSYDAPVQISSARSAHELCTRA